MVGWSSWRNRPTAAGAADSPPPRTSRMCAFRSRTPMAGEGAFLMEDFLEAIASQLDRAQDALAFKAINRPLTYAIRDFAMALQVFVDLDQEGNVRLRASGPNEVGASTVNIGFTTVTRPMIEENTISLAQTRTPTLAEAGFAPAERRSLERLGVRNTAQLRRLGTSTGA